MKKCSTLSVFFLLLSVLALAQKHPYEYGFQGGLVVGSANGSAIVSASKDRLTGMGFGIHFKRNFSPNVGLKIKINYEQMGWAYRSSFVEGNGNNSPALDRVDVLYRLPFLNIPVLAEYAFGKQLKVYVNAGPFIGFLLDSKFLVRYKDRNEPDVTSSTNRIKSLNAGIATGIGMSYPLSSTLKINLASSQQFGMMDVENNSQSNLRTNLNAFTFMTGVSFSF